MLRSRARRALTLLVLVCSVLAMPPTVWAAPPREGGDSPSFIVRIWDWVQATWGHGSGGVDPSGVVRQTAPTTPLAESVVDDGLRDDVRSPLVHEHRTRAD